MDEEERYRINVFDWDAEFAEIMKAGGFDAVIGNPPYVVIARDIYSKNVFDYYNNYPISQYKVDLFHLFIQKGCDLLSRNGRFGYIVPNQWLTLKHTNKLRKYILNNVTISEVVIFEHLVFKSADVHTALIFFEKKSANPAYKIRIKKPKELSDMNSLERTNVSLVKQQSWKTSEGSVFETRLIGSVGKLVQKISENWPPLTAVAKASLGCQAYNRSKHSLDQIKQRIFHSAVKAGKDYLPELAGKDVMRYRINRTRGQWIKYGPWLHDYRTMDWLQGPRILIREIPDKPPYRIQGCYVEKTYCNYKTILNVNPTSNTEFSMKYLLGLLNSRLISFIYPFMSNKMVAQSFPRLSVGDLKKLPIRNIDLSTRTGKSHHDNIVNFVDQMLSMSEQIPKTKTTHEGENLKRQMDSINRQIDKLVYELYGLTDKEIKIIEKGS